MGDLIRLTQADNDEHLIDLWLATRRSPRTKSQYWTYSETFLDFVRKPLRDVTLTDVLAYRDSLAHFAAATVKTRMAVIRSLYSFAQKLGYLRFSPAAAVPLPAAPRRLDQRILSESEVQRMIGLTNKDRDRRLLILLYYSGARVSEAAGLVWKDLIERDQGRGQITVVGKGDKERSILLPPGAWSELTAHRGEPETPVFKSQKGGALSARQMSTVVKQAAERAGIDRAVSPHFLRHAHATHTHQRGCPLGTISDTLGHTSAATTSLYLHSRPDDSSALWLD